MKKLLLIALLIVGCEEAGITSNGLTDGTAVTDTLYVFNYDTLIVTNYDTTIVYDTLIVSNYDTLVVVDTVYITSEDVYGCTDINATNFDADANIFDNSCKYPATTEFTDFETIRGIDEFGNLTEIIGDGIWGGCIQSTLFTPADETIEDNSQNNNQGGNNVVAVPVEFELIAAFPNPFFGTTTINIAVPSYALINIYIINDNYEIVKTLINENLSAGNHSFLWSSVNDEGSIVEDGFYRVIVTNGSVECFSNLQLTNPQ